MELKIRVANPAGNVTIFVMSPAKREDYPAISRELLCIGRTSRRTGGFCGENAGWKFSHADDGR